MWRVRLAERLLALAGGRGGGAERQLLQELSGSIAIGESTSSAPSPLLAALRSSFARNYASTTTRGDAKAPSGVRRAHALAEEVADASPSPSASTSRRKPSASTSSTSSTSTSSAALTAPPAKKTGATTTATATAVETKTPKSPSRTAAAAATPKPKAAAAAAAAAPKAADRWLSAPSSFCCCLAELQPEQQQQHQQPLGAAESAAESAKARSLEPG